MRNCKDCKSWEDPYCEKIEWIERRDKLEGNTFGIVADALDDTDLYVRFKTGAMFGCTRFEYKGD